MFVNEVIGGGFDGVGNTKGLGNAFDEVGFAGTKFALESDDEGVSFEEGKMGGKDF